MADLVKKYDKILVKEKKRVEAIREVWQSGLSRSP